MEKPHWIIWFANFEFLFIRSISTVFCCLQAVVWTQIAAWKWNQSLILRWVYSSRDNKHQCLFLCLQIGTEGNSKWPEQLQNFDTFTQRLRTTQHLFSIQLLWKPEILNVEDKQTKFERSNDHWHERNWANTWICVDFKMLVDKSYRYTCGFEAIGDLIAV